MRTINGTTGNDRFFATLWDELFLGGDGFDTVDYSRSKTGVNVQIQDRIDIPRIGSGGYAQGDALVGIESVVGSRFNDTLRGNYLDNVFFGASGEDKLYGGRGADTLFGGEDRDTLYGGYDSDTLSGGEGSDSLDGGDGIDTASFEDLSEGVGVTVDLALRSAMHGAETDTLTEIENILGSLADDSITGDETGNVLSGQGGSDWLFGAMGEDILDGGIGDDDLFGGGDNDKLLGGDGNDHLGGQEGDDTVFGGEGDDTLFGGEGADTMDGEGGFDHLAYNDRVGVLVDLDLGLGLGGDAEGDVLSGIESVRGSWSSDHLLGSADSDTLDGNAGDDMIDGRKGADRLVGGNGNDQLTGGEGEDTFVFDFADPTPDHFWYVDPNQETPDDHDLVLDFEVGIDHIELREYHGNTPLSITQVGDNAVLFLSMPQGTVTFAAMNVDVLKAALVADGFLL